ncbi:hypothetical protein BDP27DRAFT_619658 [Rhodocollybia butyracea]|uniref:Uncharacterized protein n=1 Tax=Rhodocollybia butyracea TaxID=206335 RepID=A0A9P5PXJ3_9AGAR|nr:hypothetical protein BDP27DRAFT_619658 [Rhodocollybia butyracea]
MSKEDLRVSIETMGDWSHIKTSYAQAAKISLETELAAAGLSKSDTLYQHLDRFVEQTFRLVQPNLRVNGQSFDELGKDDIEPFNEALDRHVWSLHDQRLGLHKTIASTRRKDPSKIEKAVLNSLEQDHKLDAIESELDDTHEDFGMNVDGGSDIQHNVEQGLHKTCAMAKELSQSIPNQTGRTERLKIVTAELKKPEWR